MGVFTELIEACDRLRQLGPVLRRETAVLDLARYPAANARAYTEALRGLAHDPLAAAQALSERTEWGDDPQRIYRSPSLGASRGAEVARRQSRLTAPQAPEATRQQSRLIEALGHLSGWIRRLAGRMAGVPTVGPRKTVAEEVRGLSLGQRWERLAASGRLLSEEQVRRHTLRRRITAKDIVRESERQEEQERQRARKPPWWRPIAGRLMTARGPFGAAIAHRGVSGVARGALGFSAGLAGGLLALGLAAVKASQGVAHLGDAALGVYRGLERYSGQIAAMAAMAEYRQRLRDIRFVQATGPRASALAQELEKLKDDLQPLAILGQQIKTDVLFVAVEVARGVAWLAKIGGLLEWIVQHVPWWQHNNDADLAPVQQWLRRLANLSDGAPRGPQNRRPFE